MGAAESNAGDDFHFWWAAGRALALIKPGTATRLLTVEGLTHLDDPDDLYEIADVAEYLGGDSFDDATAVLISQLKYSTRHPTRPWTAAQLGRKRSRRRVDGSRGQIQAVEACDSTSSANTSEGFFQLWMAGSSDHPDNRLIL